MDRLTEYEIIAGHVHAIPKVTDMDAVVAKLAHYEDLAEAGRLVELPCAVGDTIYELCKCDDGEYRIFPMVVVDINAYGALRSVKDKDKSLYNIYAESEYTYLFASFYDIGKTIFQTREEAEAALKERETE